MNESAPPPARLRLLHVTESAFGGVGTYLNQILPLLADAFETDGGAEIRLLMPERDRVMVPDFDPAKTIGYRRHSRSLLDLLRLARAALTEVRRFRPDIVHLHSSFAGFVLRPLLMITRLLIGRPRSIVYSAHGWAFQISGSRMRRAMIVLVERLLASMTARIIVLSESERLECIDLGFPADRLVRIYNGVACHAKQPVRTSWEDERLKVFFVGRFDRQKGLDVLFESVRPLADQITVRCAGASVASKQGPAEVPENVTLLGWMPEPEINGMFAASDIVAVPSRWEGFGLVAIEAMRAGLPVIASRVGGLPEIVEDGVTGRLVPSDDALALRSALLRDDAEARRAMGEAGRARFLARFTSERSAAAIGAVYRDLATRGAAS